VDHSSGSGWVHHTGCTSERLLPGNKMTEDNKLDLDPNSQAQVEEFETFPSHAHRNVVQAYYARLLTQNTLQINVPDDVVKLIVSYANTSFEVGDHVLTNKGNGKLFEVNVVEMKEGWVRVSYNNWGDYHNEWISFDDSNPRVINFHWNDPIRLEWKRHSIYSVGEVVSVFQEEGIEYTCEVLQIANGYVKISYPGFGSGWDEWIEETDHERLRKKETTNLTSFLY
jgi:hypothetical protein